MILDKGTPADQFTVLSVGDYDGDIKLKVQNSKNDCVICTITLQDELPLSFKSNIALATNKIIILLQLFIK